MKPLLAGLLLLALLLVGLVGLAVTWFVRVAVILLAVRLLG